MGFFKKNNGTPPEAPEANEKPKDDKASTKKKASDLPKVLDESVWESVHEDLKKNKRFILNENGTTKYVALLFSTDEIGGLAGKEAKRDESKGSIIEAIRTGRIKTYIRMEMLMDDCFIIIPDSETIANMDEFRMLIDAKYTLCTIDKSGNAVTATIGNRDDADEIVLTFAQVKEFAESDTDIRTLFTGKQSDMFTGSDVDYDNVDGDDIEDIDDIPSNINETPDEFDDFNAHVNQPAAAPTPQAQPVVTQSAPQPVQQPVQTPVQPVVPAAADDEEFDFGDDDVDADYDDDYADITEESVKQYVSRTFYSDDLGLEVSTEPFDAQFLHGNAFLEFDVNRGKGYLNEQMSNLAKDANTRMARLHQENLFRLRERYMKIISDGCANISNALDISSEDTQFGKFRFAIETRREQSLANVPAAVQHKINDCEAAWENTLRSVGDQAAAAAIAEYKNRYGMSHQRDIDMMTSREKDEIERDYQNAMKRLNEDRKAEATKLLDVLINETLSDLSKIYLQCLTEERQEYIRLQNQLSRFLDENRKHEITRIEALAEENRSRNRAEEVRAEYVGKIKAMAADFESRAAALQADLAQMRIDRDNELRLRRSEWEAKLAEEQAKTASLQAQVDDWVKRYKELDHDTNEKYKSQITRLESENSDYREQLDHVVDTHKRNNKLAIYLVIAALIAALGAGFMIGSIADIRRTSKAEQDAAYKVQQDIADDDGDDTPDANADDPSHE